MAGAAAGEIAQVEVERDAFWIDLDHLGRGDLRLHQRHAEFLHAKAAADPYSAARARLRFERVGHHHPIGALLCALRDLPSGLRAAAAVPVHGQFVFFFRALMLDHDFLRQAVRRQERESLDAVPPIVVLHAHGFAGAQQRPVEHGRGNGGTVPRSAAQVEAPAGNAFVPLRHHERQVLAEAGRHDELPVVGGQAGGQAFLFRQGRGQPRTPLRIGFATEIDLAPAILDGDLRPGDGSTGIERRDPDQRTFPAPLEMDREIGDQGSGLHVVRLVTGAKQRCAQTRARQFDDVEAGLLQRNAHHFERPRALRFGHVHALYPVALDKN